MQITTLSCILYLLLVFLRYLAETWQKSSLHTYKKVVQATSKILIFRPHPEKRPFLYFLAQIRVKSWFFRTFYHFFQKVSKISKFFPDNFFVCIQYRDNVGQVSARYLKKPRRRYNKHESVVIHIYRSQDANFGQKSPQFWQHETHQCAKF